MFRTVQARQQAGARLLNEACDMLDRFCVFPSNAQRDAVALWILSTHARDNDQMMVWNAHGILGLLASTPNAGKSTALTVVAHLAYGDDPTLEMNPSPRGMMQAINEEHTPLFIDNLDTWWKRSAASPDAKAIILAYKYGTRKRILNAKHNLYEATAISAVDANLRNNPDMADVLSRMIRVQMRQKRPDQHVDTWDGRIHDIDARQLRLAMTAWGKYEADDLAMAYPDTPDGLDKDGRAVEIWTPLLATGNSAGPVWAARAVTACKALALSDAEAMDDTPVLSATDTLLAALAEVLDPREDQVSSRDLIERLQHGTYRWKAGIPLKKAAMELSKQLKTACMLQDLPPVGPVPYWDAERGSVQGYNYADLQPLLPALVDMDELLEQDDLAFDPAELPL